MIINLTQTKHKKETFFAHLALIFFAHSVAKKIDSYFFGIQKN